jgi:hypothetical protein
MSESRIKPISSRLCDLLCKHSYLTFEDTYMALDITEAQLKTAIGNYNYNNRFNGGSLISRYQLEEDQIVCFDHNKPAGALPIKRGGGKNSKKNEADTKPQKNDPLPMEESTKSSNNIPAAETECVCQSAQYDNVVMHIYELALSLQALTENQRALLAAYEEYLKNEVQNKAT